MQILVGKGIFCVVNVPTEPKSGEVINLGDDKPITKGRYELTREGSRAFGSSPELPYYVRRHIGDIPDGEEPLETSILNI